ncbi:MAG: hypothetical protein OXH00_16870 [Candidatus Poribacteria bacterium]|nr:hypothetical protein [Candidatus Poribacteria bacterium]
MEQIGEKKWDGREWEIWSGFIGELRQLIPTFTIHDFRIGNGINKYKSVIVREPYGYVDIGAEVDPVKGVRIPIQVVRKRYEGVVWENFTPKNAILGYDLIQHYDLLDRVLETLKAFSERETKGIVHVTPLTEPESLAAKMEISTYGARIRIEFLVQNFIYYVDDGAPYALKVICHNSMDKRIAVRVHLYLYREGTSDIPFRGFYSRHKPEELKEGEIERLLGEELMRIARGDWITATAEKETVIELSKKYFDGKWVESIRFILERSGEAGSNRVRLYQVREKVSKLIADISELGLQERQEIKLFYFLHEIDKVLEEEAKEKERQEAQPTLTL